MKTSRSDIEKNIWVPASILLGIQFQKWSDPEFVKWMSIFSLIAIIFWCWRWLLWRKNGS